MRKQLELPEIGNLVWQEGEGRKERKMEFSPEPKYLTLRPVTEMILQLPSQEIDLLSYVPPNYNIETGAEEFSCSDITSKIFVKDFNSEEDLFHTLHEIGHARDFVNKPITNEQRAAYSLLKANWPQHLTPTMLYDILELEGRAWKEALRILHAMELPDQVMQRTYSLIRSEESFGAYISRMTSQNFLQGVADNCGINSDTLSEELTNKYRSWMEKLSIHSYNNVLG